MKDEPEIALRKIREQLPHILAVSVIMAELHRAKYVALLAQGFTEAQALELCKVVP